LFNALEIKALNLNAQLAILSSCNSGVGENFSGNGLRSLGQSFFEAGCQSVIVNLWEAGDKSSKKIISSFMSYLNEGLPKAEALRKAKIDFLAQASDSEKHPKYWANIVLIGNDAPITFNSGYPKWIYILGGIVILLLLGWTVFRKRKEVA
jgi:CHAT domain-containing protein